MKAVLTADIIKSSQISSEQWMEPLKKVLSKYGSQGTEWEIYRGDEIQLLLKDPQRAFSAAIALKTVLRKHDFDARISIGLGDLSYKGSNIKESNGTAFIHSGRNLEALKSSKLQTLSIKSSYVDYDENFNLLFRLLENQFEKWKPGTVTSMAAYFEHKNESQTQVADKLGITQGAFSRALKRGGLENILDLDRYFRKKTQELH